MAFSVILADRHNLFLRTFSKLMQSEFTDLSVLGEVDNFNELGTILGKAHPDLLIIDYCLKDGQLFDHLTGIRQNYPDMKIIVFTMKFNLSTMLQYIGAIDGFIGKHAELHEIAYACEEVLKGNTYFDIASEI